MYAALVVRTAAGSGRCIFETINNTTMEKHEKFLDFNGRKVFFLNADGQWWIALKPICEALGVDYEAQRKRLKRDPILAQLPSDQTVVAADGKPRMMVCLPEEFIYGWLFTIESKDENLVRYKRDCYHLLFQHFRGVMIGRTEAIRERVLAMKEMEQIRKELSADERYKRLQELQGVVLSKGKQLKQADLAIEREQLNLFSQS